MTADATSSYFPSMPPTFGWRRVVELADEFKVSTADMLAICDRLGVIVEDASEWLDPDTVDMIRNIVGLNGPKAVLSNKPAPEPKPIKAPKPPKAEKAPKPPKAVKPPKLKAVKPPKAEKAPKPPKPPKAVKPPKLKAVKPPKAEKAPRPEKAAALRAEKPATTLRVVAPVKAPKPPRPEKAPKPPKAPRAEKAPKPPRAEKAPKPEKLPKPPKAEKAPKAARSNASPELGSVSRDGVRTGRVVLIGLIIAILAGASGILVDRWVDYVTHTDAPATVVTTGER